MNWTRRFGHQKSNNGQKTYNNKESGSKLTTTLFVPQSKNGFLFNKIVELEKKNKPRYDWDVKILEQSGRPLLLSFAVKFPINIGCPRGSRCKMCKNDGVICSSKSVVYSATCTKCHDKDDLKKLDQGLMTGH